MLDILFPPSYVFPLSQSDDHRRAQREKKQAEMDFERDRMLDELVSNESIISRIDVFERPRVYTKINCTLAPTNSSLSS